MFRGIYALPLSILSKVRRAAKCWQDQVFIAPGSIVSANVSIGKCTRINASSYIGPCKIGSFVACGGRLVVRSSDHYTCYANMQDWTQRYIVRSQMLVAGKTKGLVEIKSGSWIGDSVIILPAGSIGYGAVVGAGSVVTKPIPDFAVAVGNPARVIKYRFPEHCIAFLLRIRWWDWSLKKIRNNKHFFEIDFTAVDLKMLKDIESRLQ